MRCIVIYMHSAIDWPASKQGITVHHKREESELSSDTANVTGGLRLYSSVRNRLTFPTPSCTTSPAFLRRFTNPVPGCGWLQVSSSPPIPTAESIRVPPASKADMAESCAFLGVVGGTLSIVSRDSRPSNQLKTFAIISRARCSSAFNTSRGSVLPCFPIGSPLALRYSF